MGLSTFMGLQTALRGILAQQQALDITGHNIANANTVGYTRQQAVLTPTPAYSNPGAMPGQIGTGVDVTSYQRIRDEFIDTQLHAQTMRQGYYGALQDGLSQVETSLAEPSDNGISSLLQGFWSSWQDLSNNPESAGTRQALVQSAASLADGFRQLSSQLTTIQSQAGQNVTQTLSEINSATASIAQLNDSIMKAKVVGDTPNDLMDQRDMLVDQLSQLVNVTRVDNPDGTIDLKVGSTSLVTGAASTPRVETDFTAGDITAGKLAGLIQVRDVVVPQQLSDLNGIASQLITAVNAVHTSGVDLNGNPGVAFFTGTSAADIAVSAPVAADPSLVAASANGQPGDPTNALKIAALQTSTTINTDYQRFVTKVGSDSRDATRTYNNAKSLADSLESRRQSVSGVSLDEEMTNLVRFQRGFQASARALTAMDDMIDLLVSRTGKVGL